MIKPIQTVHCTVSVYSLTSDSLSQFLASLVASNLEQVLRPAKSEASKPVVTPVTHLTGTSSHFTGEALTQFLSTMEPDIARVARNIYYRTATSVEIDDLFQEGMIAVWHATTCYDESKVKEAGSFRGYCMKRARGAMFNFLSRGNKVPATSLEAYLEVDTHEGTMQRELPDTSTAPTLPTLSQRRRILAALRHLTKNERLVAMAAYCIDDNRGRCLTSEEIKQRLNLTSSAYYSTRARAMKKLASVLQEA